MNVLGHPSFHMFSHCLSVVRRPTATLTTSRLAVPFQFLPNRNMAAMRWSAELGFYTAYRGGTAQKELGY
jgi:hypothetical protein